MLLWALAVPPVERFPDPASGVRSVGVALGLAGTAAFAGNLILGARLRLVDRLFGGLDRMYRVHHANGVVAFLLLLAHALLMVVGYAVTSLDALGRMLSAEQGSAVLVGVVALVAMAVSMFLTLFVRLNHEVFVYLQRSFGFIFLIATFHVFMTPAAKAEARSVSFYMAAVASAGLLAFGYRSLFGDVLVRRHEYRVAEVNRLDETVTEIAMVPKEQPISFRPGQFVFLTFRSEAMSKDFHPLSVLPEGRSAVISFRAGAIANQFHPFSITSRPHDRALRVAVKAVGDYTTALRKLEVGAGAIVEGAYGEFSYLNVPSRRQIWLAGGIGVTPFVSMARSLEADSGHDIDFYYSTKSRAEAHFLDELLELAERHPSFRVVPFPEDELGFITAAHIARTSGDLAARDILMCGPPAMIDSLRSQLVAAGVAREQIHFEEFGFAGKVGG